MKEVSVFKKANRYSVLLSGILVMLVVGLLYAWSLFRPFLNELFPSWTATNLSSIFTVSMVTFSLSMFVCGKLQNKLGCRITLLITAALMLIGFVGASFLNPDDPNGSYIRLIIFYGVFCGSAVGFGYNTSLSTVPFWFPDNFGLLMGIVLTAYGMSSLIFGGIARSIIVATGIIKAFRILAIVCAAIIFLCSFLMKKVPEGYSPAKKNASADAKPASKQQGHDYTTKEMLLTLTFWLTMMAGVVRAAGGLSVVNSAATIATYFGAPAMVGMVVSLFNSVGRLSAGAIQDRFGYVVGLLLNAAIGVTAAGSLIVGSLIKSPAVIVAGFVFTGLAYGGANPVLMAFMKEAFGAKHYAANVGIAGLAILPASFLGPLLTGYLQDTSAADNLYGSTFIAMLVLYGLNLLLCILYLSAAKKMKEKEKKLYSNENA